MDLLHLWCIIGVILQRTVNGQQLVSQGKPVTSSSQHKTWSPDKAVDGKKTRSPDTCDCCAATNQDTEPWYKLDLEQTYMVQRINVIGRTALQSLREMEIKLGTSKEGGTVLTKNTDEVFTYDYTLPSPQLGRYVTLTLRGITQYFIICELEVYVECNGNTYGNLCVPCGQCLNGDPCDKNDGSCQSCAAGFQGNRCDQVCDPFTYGLDCNEKCGNCSNNESCNRFNGSCPGGCSVGVKGELCKEPCGDGFYGQDCRMRCGNCSDGETCDAKTGICRGGCSEGFNGTYCNMTCPDGTFGRNCASKCGTCFQGAFCRTTNGKCEQGCEPGYKEPTCITDITECEDGTYGEGCTSICGNCHGDEICNKQNGTCQACECGYTGHDCKGILGGTNPAASRGDCPNVAMIVGGTLVSILVIEGVAAAIFVLIRKRHSIKKDTVNRSNPYELPNRAINEGEHEYESAMELDVTTNAYENTGPEAP